MKLTKPVAYALRILGAMAKDPEGVYSASTIAEQEGIPESRVRRVLMDLRKAGILKATKGRQGGYRLAKPLEKIPVASVIKAVDDGLDLALASQRRRETHYIPEKGFPSARFWEDVEKRFWKSLEETSLADILSS